MPRYVDGYVLPVPKKNLAAYKRMAGAGCRVWTDNGALQYMECRGDDLLPKFGVSFLKGAKARKDETVFFSFVVFKSKAHRNKVNARVMKDPRLAKMMTEKMPFDCKRMMYGGFKMMVGK